MRTKMTSGDSSAIVLDQNVEYLISKGWVVFEEPQEVIAEDIIEEDSTEEDTLNGDSQGI